jgi:hypothetical protein
MEITKRFKDNLGIIIAIGTIVTMAFGILNFFLLNSISPIEKRVVALEISIKNYMPLELSLEKWKNNDASHALIEKKLDNIDAKVDRLLSR